MSILASLQWRWSRVGGSQVAHLAHIVLPSGQRVGAWMIPQVTKAYELGTMPPLLPMLDGPKVERA